jgi:hypothetical protein
VTFDPSGARAAVAAEGQVQVWDVSRFRLEWRSEIPGEARSLAFSSDGGRLAAGTRLGDVFVWDLATDDGIRRSLRIDGPVLALSFPDSGPALLMQSSEWLHRVEDQGPRLEITASQLLPGYLPENAWRPARSDGSRVVFLDQSGAAPTLSVLGWDTRVLPADGVAPTLQADPWPARLKLALDSRGAIVPWSAEASGEAASAVSDPAPAVSELQF